MWLLQCSSGGEKEGGPDLNIRGTWAQTVTGVLVIMNTFKLLRLCWEGGQQLENVFTVTNFLYQSLGCQGDFTFSIMKQVKGRSQPTTTQQTHIPVTLAPSVCLSVFVIFCGDSLCFCIKISTGRNLLQEMLFMISMTFDVCVCRIHLI